jgi:bifunctional non-homologous end joining protein LigD
LSAIEAALKALVASKPPVRSGLKLAPKDVVWVKPQLVCDVKYNEWTREGLLRQATFLRIRTDLVPADCTRETPS